MQVHHSVWTYNMLIVHNADVFIIVNSTWILYIAMQLHSFLVISSS